VQMVVVSINPLREFVHCRLLAETGHDERES